MRVLVTGGAGYIGSIASDRLVNAGHSVTVLDDLTMGWREAVPVGAQFVQGNIKDRALLSQLFGNERYDAIVHCAAFIEAGESVKVPEIYFENNSFGTLTLLQTALEHSVNKFVFSSTAAVYGEPRVIPIPEDHPLFPTNAYGESKLIVERMLGWFHSAHGLRYSSLRYFNAAGATDSRGEAHRKESHLIPLILQVPLGQREAISIFGTDYGTKDGTAIRDYIHVLDLADAHLLALEALDQHTQLVCNLGSGSGFTVREVLDVARRVTGHPIPAIECPRRRGDPAVLVASSQKIETLLGWRRQHSDIEEIVASAWAWHQANPNSYRTPAKQEAL